VAGPGTLGFAAVDLATHRYGAAEIVVGHRGRTLFKRWLLGSVAKYVIDHAPCAVLVAR
jgi:nucleotide-binding universal stress UspA family protein